MNPFIIQRLIQKIKNSESQFLTEFQLSSDEKSLLEYYKKQIQDGLPLDYILGEIKFNELILDIQEGVFIPREETEWWVNLIHDAKNGQGQILPKNFLKILQNTDNLVDLCSGSGYIGLSLSSQFKKVLAADFSSVSVKISRANAQKNLVKNYKVYESNLFEFRPFKEDLELLDSWILTCNPPYVPLSDYSQARQNKVDREPFEAIYSGSDGLDCFRQIIAGIKKLKNKPALCFFELDPRNIHEAEDLAMEVCASSIILEDQNKLSRLLILQI